MSDEYFDNFNLGCYGILVLNPVPTFNNLSVKKIEFFKLHSNKLDNLYLFFIFFLGGVFVFLTPPALPGVQLVWLHVCPLTL